MRILNIYLTYYNIPDTENDPASYFYAGIIATPQTLNAIANIPSVEVAAPNWLPKFGKQLEITAIAIEDTTNAWYAEYWDNESTLKHVIACLQDFFTALGYIANITMVYDLRTCKACDKHFYTLTPNSKKTFCRDACRKYFNKYGKRKTNKQCPICHHQHNRRSKFCSQACKQKNWRNQQLRKNYLLAKCPRCKTGNLRAYKNLWVNCSASCYNQACLTEFEETQWEAIKFMTKYGSGFDDSPLICELDELNLKQLYLNNYQL